MPYKQYGQTRAQAASHKGLYRDCTRQIDFLSFFLPRFDILVDGYNSQDRNSVRIIFYSEPVTSRLSMAPPHSFLLIQGAIVILAIPYTSTDSHITAQHCIKR
ncbi:uncharacterized protein ASPGLDRAFT_334267 [Aspergillus glaucus CBS 516.65]|uniref:Uncharacterized protein n=1 Tax=Aspergillus glaucus CBS 516.65 TaxID=1160497 RepID=A0A1L9VKM3_ASPGL|nr:hypothetical protein ASPGLDRAFT_334267 [Aspergillus glaucus CBS 516.65]OJJ84467.1 hypothetical protein ASPGLDRAFT_334267 [Aspergillus glaucus CBS 516.65]